MAKIRSEENNWRTDYLTSQKELEFARREYFLAEDLIRGFDLEEILLVAHGGHANDTIVTVERKNRHILKLF